MNAKLGSKILALAVGTVLVASACSSGSGKTTADQNVALTFWSWVPGIDTVVAQWNSAHPNIHVTVSKQAQGEKSDLVPSLPLAATSPALCGALAVWPTAPQTGAGSTAGPENLGIFGLGGALLALGGTGLVLARRRTVTADHQV